MFGVVNRPNGYDQRLVDEIKPITNILSLIIESSGQAEELRYLATTDPLTGVNNRRQFEKYLKKYCRKTVAGLPSFCLLLLDVDDFKVINDTYGHPIGDKVLNILAKRIKNNLRSNDIVARIGGDEFAVILTGMETEQVVFALVDKLEARLKEKINFSHNDIQIMPTVSIGVACYPEHGETTLQLMANADAALYLSKKDHQVHFYAN